MSDPKKIYSRINKFIDDAYENRTDEDILKDLKEEPNPSFLANIAKIRKINTRAKAAKQKALSEKAWTVFSELITELGPSSWIESILSDQVFQSRCISFFSKLHSISEHDRYSTLCDHKYLDVIIDLNIKDVIAKESATNHYGLQERSAAQSVLKYCGIWNNPRDLNIEDVVLARGVSTVQAIQIDGAQGRIVCKNEDAIISYNSRIEHHGKRRFVIAHELGHYELHRHLIEPIHIDDYRSLSHLSKSTLENQANEFAAELLMPTHLFSSLIEGERFNLHFIKEIAQHFEVSITAAIIRYINIGKNPVGVIYSSGNEIQWSSFSNNFKPNFIERGSNLPPETMAGNFVYHKKRLPGRPQTTKLENWFLDRNMTELNNQENCYEQCLNMGGDSVLTCLWMDN